MFELSCEVRLHCRPFRPEGTAKAVRLLRSFDGIKMVEDMGQEWIQAPDETFIVGDESLGRRILVTRDYTRADQQMADITGAELGNIRGFVISGESGIGKSVYLNYRLIK